MPPLDQTPSPVPIRPPVGGTPAPVKKPVGPVVGIVIILILLVFGALYFWGQYLNSQDAPDPLPLIPGDSTTSL